MKNLLTILCFASFTSAVFAQTSIEKTPFCEAVHVDEAPFSAINAYSENDLTDTATVPSYETMTHKLKLTGVVYENDGTTPATNVIVYIELANEAGEYELVNEAGAHHVNHRAWIKTGADGRYTFYAFVPGATEQPMTKPTRHRPQHIHVTVKEEGQPAYELASFLFESDPLLTKSCKKKLTKRGLDIVLTTVTQDDILVAKKNITLEPKSATADARVASR